MPVCRLHWARFTPGVFSACPSRSNLAGVFPEVTLTFTISIFVLGVAAFFGGLWLNRKGPRIVALTGGFLYGGVFLASFSDHKLRCRKDVRGGFPTLPHRSPRLSYLIQT